MNTKFSYKCPNCNFYKTVSFSEDEICSGEYYSFQECTSCGTLMDMKEKPSFIQKMKNIYYAVILWLSPSWYSYLFKPWKGWRTVICRVGGHKCGVVWYNPTGLEPDMHCQNCGDDLG